MELRHSAVCPIIFIDQDPKIMSSLHIFNVFIIMVENVSIQRVSDNAFQSNS